MAEEHPPSPSLEDEPLSEEIPDQVRNDVLGWILILAMTATSN